MDSTQPATHAAETLPTGIAQSGTTPVGGVSHCKSAQLLVLRGQCLATVAAIDAILGSLPESLAADPQIQPFSVDGVCSQITAHAIARYRQRTGTKKGEVATLNKIRERLERADEWVLKPKYRLIELLAHGQESKFWKHNDFIFVVENGVVVTCHHGTADRWMPKPKEETK